MSLGARGDLLVCVPRAILVSAVIYESGLKTGRQIEVRFDKGTRYPCCDGTSVAGGEYAEVADRLRVLVEASPQYALLFYNLACCESVAGRAADALDHLRHAIEMSEEFREFAKDDSDLDPIRDEPAFNRLIGG